MTTFGMDKENHTKIYEVEFNLYRYLLSIQNLIQLNSDTLLLPLKYLSNTLGKNDVLYDN